MQPLRIALAQTEQTADMLFADTVKPEEYAGDKS